MLIICINPMNLSDLYQGKFIWTDMNDDGQRTKTLCVSFWSSAPVCDFLVYTNFVIIVTYKKEKLHFEKSKKN